MALSINPCVKCGSTDIVLYDHNYSSFNPGGGMCKQCGHKATGEVGCLPSQESLADMWNKGNPIFDPQKRIKELVQIIYDAVKEKKELILKYGLDDKNSP